MDRKIAHPIIARHQERAPVDVQAIATALGLSVFEDDLVEGVSGILRKDVHGGTSGYSILVNRQHPTNRKRFTVAHEIAHFVLHRDALTNDLIEDEFYRALSNKLEWEANDFAADILMPWSLINRLSDKGIRSLPELATALGVSKQAIAIRLGLPYDQTWE